MSKKPALWVLVLSVVVFWNFYQIFGPQDEAPSQGVLVLTWICLVLASVGLVGAVIQLVQQKKRENA
jgi:hypothetical protein